MRRIKRAQLIAEKAFLRYGSNVPMICGRSRLRVPAMVERRHSKSKYRRLTDFSDVLPKQIGNIHDNQLLVMTPYVEELHGTEAADHALRMVWRGKTYDCIYDSAVIVGDVPIYVWHIFAPVSAPEGDYEP